MPGLLDLSTELRLTIFKDVFDHESETALIHPLLQACQTTRLEYIDIISGTFFLSILGTPGLATHPDLDPQLYRTLTPKFSIIRTQDNIPLHPQKKRMDFFAFADSPCAWLIEHACGALIRPTYFDSGCRRLWPSKNYSRPGLKYRLSFGKGVEIQASLDYDLEMIFSSKKGEMLEIARKELAYWKSEQIVEEDSEPLTSNDKSLHGRQRRWIVAFMRDFDADGLEYKMTGKLRSYARPDPWQDYILPGY